ncbi:MAG: hypothetical protein L6R36_006623 [Xanthoria steineri]|nr:MAG: hypothetical protein L6R36_006623 [Xanthoria steineri]
MPANSIPSQDRCSHHWSRTMEVLAAGTLTQIYREDYHKSSRLPPPITPAQVQTKNRLCLSFIFQCAGRLSPEYYRRFLDALKAYKSPDTIDVTREKFSVIFELAKEYELWEEVLELCFPVWRDAKEAQEEAEYKRMQENGLGLPI